VVGIDGRSELRGHESPEHLDREQPGNPRHGVVDPGRDTRVLLIHRAQHRRRQWGHGHRKAETEYQQRRQQLGEVGGMDPEPQQEKESRAGDDHADPTQLGVLGVLCDDLRLAMGELKPVSGRIPRSARLAPAGALLSMSRLAPITYPTSRASTSVAPNVAATGGTGRGVR